MKSLLTLLLLTLCCTSHIAQSQLQPCYNDRGEPTRCQPPEQSFSFQRQPSANSTCGAPPSGFCLRTVRLGQISSNCYQICDASDPANAHPPEYMTDFLTRDTWWQSDNSLVTENMVVIDIALDTLVEVNVVSFQFQSFIPRNFRILKSVDAGSKYTDFHYFSTSCIDDYSIPSNLVVSLENETSVFCTEVRTPPFPDQISFFPQLDRPSVNDSIPGFSEPLYQFMSATDIRVVLVEHYAIPNLPQDDLGYYYAIRDLNVLGSCQCHGHASECRLDSTLDSYYCMCQHNTTGTHCDRCSDFFQDVPWQRHTGAEEFECRACDCNGQSEECVFDPEVYEQTGRTGGGVCLNCRNNRAGRQCERCADLFYPEQGAETNFSCTACDCDLAGVTNNGQCSQVSDENVSAGDCSCKQNVQGRACDTCRPGYFNLSSEHELGCQECACSANGSLSEFCDPVSGLCPCKPNVQGEQCDSCQPGFYLPDPSSNAGCQACGCDVGGSTSSECDEVTGMCPCRPGIAGRACSEVQEDYFVRDLDFLRLEAEDGADVSNQVIVTNTQNRFFTGTGFYRVEDGVSVIDFGSLTPPIDGPYNIVVHYSLEGAMLWNTSTLTVTPSGSEGPTNCGQTRAVTGQTTLQYTNYMMGVGLSVTRSLCLSAGQTYSFTLGEFESGQSNSSAALNIDSLVLIPAESFLPTEELSLIRDYMECAMQYRSLATRPSNSITCRATIFTASALIYDGATACNCDVVGTIMGTSCAEIGGQCDCLPGVRGRTCDICTPGFYNLTRTGCTACDCDPAGSVGQLCDVDTGDCMCVENMNGQTCSSCIPDYWGFNNCMPCECNLTGSISSQCDEETGVCFCRDGVTGDSCDSCQPQTFGFSSSGCRMCACHPAGSVEEDCDLSTGQCSCLPATSGRDCSECVQGTFNLQDSNPTGCQRCFCSGISDTCSSASGFYRSQLVAVFNGSDESVLQGWRIVDSSSGNVTEVSSYPNGPGIILEMETDSYLEAPSHFLGNRLSSYSQFLSVGVEPVRGEQDVGQAAEYGVTLTGGGVTVVANLTCSESGFRVHLHESAGWVLANSPLSSSSPSSSALTSREFQAILFSLEELTVSASYSTDVVLMSISLDTAVPRSELTDDTDAMQSMSVENCTCPVGYTGLSCELCASGYTRTSAGTCELCQCNGFSSSCNPETGECFGCSGATTGPSCEVCSRGYYGDPVGGVACQPCPCPLATSPGQFTLDCELADLGNVMCLNCPAGHTGQQCESCISGYFGDPTGSMGVATGCSDCQCSGNIDTEDPSSCNRVTGVCERCLNNTAGQQCERCQEGFYGDAVTAKNCTVCDCNLDGSESSTCDDTTGQCPCLGNVTGRQCDQCLSGFYGLGTPSGCVSCDCVFPGSVGEQCDGQGMCDCLPGVTGAKCDQCLPGFFGLSSSGCEACSCSALNSDSALCDVTDGTCICRPGSTGDTCEQCQQNFFMDESSRCTACPECYQDLEDVYIEASNLLDTRESEIQNIDTSNLTPFDDRVFQTQSNISALQEEATALIARHTELQMTYDDLLFSVNVTLRASVTGANESLDSLKRIFTTVYVTTFTSQELMEALVSEFQAALDLAMRIETVYLPSIRTHSEAVQEDSLNVSSTAQELENIVNNSSAEVEALRSVTYEILNCSASLLDDIAALMGLQNQVIEGIEFIESTYGNLESEFDEINFNLTGFEMDLMNLTNQLRAKQQNTPGELMVPDRDEILYLTQNATEMEAFVRNDIISEIMNQSMQLATLNETYTSKMAEFEELFRQVTELGMNISSLLDFIQSEYAEALRIQEDAENLVSMAEMVAENLESFDNDTFRIARQVAEALSNMEDINRNSSTALAQAQEMEESLRDASESIAMAKQTANQALEIANASLEAISPVDTNSLVTSVNSSLQSATASKDQITAISNNVSDILTELETLGRDIAEREAQVNASEAINEQSAMDRTEAVDAVEQIRQQLESLEAVEASDLRELRQLVDQVRDEYDSAGLSGLYAGLTARLEEQRAERARLETELEGLMGDIEHLRRVNQALPNIPPGCNRGN